MDQGINGYSYVLMYILDLFHGKISIIERAVSHDSHRLWGEKSRFDKQWPYGAAMVS